MRFEPTPPCEDQHALPLNHLESALLTVTTLSLCSLDFSTLYSMCIWGISRGQHSRIYLKTKDDVVWCDRLITPSSSLHDTRVLTNLLTYGIASSVDHYVGLLLLTAQLIKLLKIADQSCGRKRTFTEIPALFLSEQAQRTGTVEKRLSCRSNGPEQ